MYTSFGILSSAYRNCNQECLFYCGLVLEMEERWLGPYEADRKKRALQVEQGKILKKTFNSCRHMYYAYSFEISNLRRR